MYVSCYYIFLMSSSDIALRVTKYTVKEEVMVDGWVKHRTFTLETGV